MKSFLEIDVKIKRFFYRVNLTMITLGGYLALWSFLQVRSTDRRSLVLGYSSKVLLTGAGMFLLVSALAVITLRSWLGKGKTLQESFLRPADKPVRRLFWGMLCISAVLGILLILVSGQQLALSLPQGMMAVLWRAGPFLAWGTASLLQTSLLWLLFQPHRESAAGNPAKGLLLVSLAVAAIYALIVILPLPLLPPGWAWSRNLRPFQSQGVWVILVLIPFFILVNERLSRKKVNPALSLAGLVVIGYILTMAVGEGPARIEFSLLNSKASIYLEKACVTESPGDVIRNYENKYTNHHWLATKPPGLLAFYTLMRQALMPGRPLNELECHQHFARAGAWLLPLLSVMLLLPLYFFSRQILGEDTAWLACAFYLTTTSLAKFARFADAFLFPLLVLITLYLLLLSLRRFSPWWALAAGIMSALSVFVSFSLLPLVGIALAWLVIRFLGSEQERKNFALAFACYLAGAVLLTLFLRYQFGYNPMERYRAAMAAHAAYKLFRPGSGQVIVAMIVNNLEYFAFSGLSVSVLFIYRFIRAVWDKRVDELSLFEGLLWAAAAAYLVMNLVGKTIGEVGRIWMFYTPLLCLGAADAVVQYFGSRRRETNLVLALQVAVLLLNISFLLILY